MVININPLQVIEAGSTGVKIMPLKQFLNRSLDSQNNPRVMVGRLKKNYHFLIPKAIIKAKAQIGKPYNDSFIMSNGKSFYCSELIDYSFKYANRNQPFFHTTPMNFMDNKSFSISESWKSYYKTLHVKVPQGLPGTNPGAMSRESMIQLIHFYGKLRQH